MNIITKESFDNILSQYNYILNLIDEKIRILGEYNNIDFGCQNHDIDINNLSFSDFVISHFIIFDECMHIYYSSYNGCDNFFVYLHKDYLFMDNDKIIEHKEFLIKERNRSLKKDRYEKYLELKKEFEDNE